MKGMRPSWTAVFIMMKIDLHIHSTASDGTETPRDIVRQCAAKGIDMCAVTDHDNVDAQKDAADESTRLGMRYVTGVEISAQYTGELHILGYGMDLADRAFREFMEELRTFRVERTLEFVRRLGEHGIDIALEDVKRWANGNTLGRPHVALALVEKGYADTYRDAFDTYLNEGGLCYVNRRRLMPREAIDLIRSAGGIPVLAHPGLITTDDLPRLVRSLVDLGLEGIEAHYPLHTDEQLASYLALAGQLGLIVTCGSDYHGASRENALGCETRTSKLLETSVERLAALCAAG